MKKIHKSLINSFIFITNMYILYHRDNIINVAIIGLHDNKDSLITRRNITLYNFQMNNLEFKIQNSNNYIIFL